MELLLAHGEAVPGGNNAALEVILVAAMVLPLIILGFVSWIFYRAKRREDAERKRKSEWQNARWS